jgi:hypothetical protein
MSILCREYFLISSLNFGSQADSAFIIGMFKSITVCAIIPAIPILNHSIRNAQSKYKGIKIKYGVIPTAIKIARSEFMMFINFALFVSLAVFDDFNSFLNKSSVQLALSFSPNSLKTKKDLSF